MNAPTPPADSAPGGAIDAELAALEQRLASLLTYARALRAANEALRRGLTAAETRNQDLSERVAEAKRRLDALVGRLPEPAE
jgi:regulator of replication initiation timing